MNRVAMAFGLFALSLTGATAPYQKQPTEEDLLRKKCAVTVSWKRRGDDATVTVSIKNGTRKKLVTPSVRVTFYDSTGEEVASDAKTYFSTIPAGSNKRLEARIWAYVPAEASSAKGVVDGGSFE